MFDEIINKFISIMDFGNRMKIASVDMNLVAIRELELMINQIFPYDSLSIKNALQQALQRMKNRGIIFDYETLDDGFKIIPQDKIYCFENDLLIKI